MSFERWLNLIFLKNSRSNLIPWFLKYNYDRCIYSSLHLIFIIFNYRLSRSDKQISQFNQRGIWRNRKVRIPSKIIRILSSSKNIHRPTVESHFLYNTKNAILSLWRLLWMGCFSSSKVKTKNSSVILGSYLFKITIISMMTIFCLNERISIFLQRFSYFFTSKSNITQF